MKVLILGGYGAFGGRLARLLADEPRLTLLLAGRSEAKAKAFVATMADPAATLIPLRSASTATATSPPSWRRPRPTCWSTPAGRSRPTASSPIAWRGPASRDASITSISPTARRS